MKKISKGVFFDYHKQEDIFEYEEICLEEIKTLLSYFVEFNDNKSILLKIYSKDSSMGDLNKRAIIIVTHDESTFSANDRQ